MVVSTYNMPRLKENPLTAWQTKGIHSFPVAAITQHYRCGLSQGKSVLTALDNGSLGPRSRQGQTLLTLPSLVWRLSCSPASSRPLPSWASVSKFPFFYKDAIMLD